MLVTVSLTGTSAATGLNSALLTDLLPSASHAGTATGILVVGGNAFGMLAPIVTGYVIAGTVISLTMTRQPIRTGDVTMVGSPSELSAGANRCWTARRINQATHTGQR